MVNHFIEDDIKNDKNLQNIINAWIYSPPVLPVISGYVENNTSPLQNSLLLLGISSARILQTLMHQIIKYIVTIEIYRQPLRLFLIVYKIVHNFTQR